MSDVKPAETFPLGEYLSDEMDERGLSHHEVAKGADIPVERLEFILAGQPATEEECRGLARVFGVSDDLFLNLNKG